MNTLKLRYPFDKNTIVQGFGANAVGAYHAMGLAGHPGIDFGVPWGTPIPSVADSYCYSTLNKDNPNLMAYRAVFTLVDVGDVTYEISYGHCSDMSVIPMRNVVAGNILANVGNTGDVYQGGILVTQAAKASGSHDGSHLHFQVRLMHKVPVGTPLDPLKHYANDGFGILTLNGYHYEVPFWDNGFNGCVDPAQFFETSQSPVFEFNSNLWFGLRSTDNIELQLRLGVSPTDQNFGPKTLLAVIKYQKAQGITPTGFVGPLTRAALNK